MTQAPLVFIGPSLSLARARAALPDAIFAGPAKCGDIYRATQLHPPAIALIDGYFDHQLSVWHKEVLWAIDQGIPVYGAASMGALRAAELADCGMTGVGTIFELFRDGVLEDDDEVAVLHAAAEHDFAPLSDAMVNIRATLRAALLEGVIDSGEETWLIAAGKRLFYPERSLERLLRDEALLSKEGRARCREWLGRHGLVDQKARDALLLLQRVSRDLAAAVPHLGSRVPFERTSYWEVLRSSVDRTPEPLVARVAPERARGSAVASPVLSPPAASSAAFSSAEVPSPTDAGTKPALQALEQQNPALHWQLKALSAQAALALLLARQSGERVTEGEAQLESEQFRIARRLLTPAQTAHWLSSRGLDLVGFSALIRDRILAARAASHAEALVEAQLIDLLTAMDPTPGGSSD